MEKRFLELVSRVFKYPTAGLGSSLSELETYCSEKMPAQAAGAALARKEAGKYFLSDLEEIYADLFYIKPLVSLDLGHQLFGDERKRVEFLLHLKGLQQAHSVDCGTELPDSLPNVLTLLTKIAEGEDRDELVGLALAPALGKMLAVMVRAKEEKDAKEKGTKDHGWSEATQFIKNRKRRSKGIPVYLPLMELLAEQVNAAAAAAAGVETGG